MVSVHPTAQEPHLVAENTRNITKSSGPMQLFEATEGLDLITVRLDSSQFRRPLGLR